MAEHFGLCGIVAIQKEDTGLKFLKRYYGNILIERMNAFGPSEYVGIYSARLFAQFRNDVGVE